MNLLEIEAFIAITETRNLSKAADKLFVSQSTISSRLTSLEQALGSPLVNRRPGVKGVTLTPKGMEFLSLASRYLEVESDINTWKKNLSRYDLKVSAPHSINSYLFTGLYPYFSDSEQLRLTISTHWNDQIYNMLDNYLLDIGFVSRSFPSRNLITVPLFLEPMVLVSDQRYSSYPTVIRTEELPVEHEVYLDWGSEFEIWHSRNWSSVKKPKVHVDTPTLVEFFLQAENAWAAVPLCVAEMTNHHENLLISTPIPAIPPRTIYLVTQREPNPSGAKVIKRFIEETKKFIQSMHCVIPM